MENDQNEMMTRLLACLVCGDAIEVPEGGGEVACHCGASHTWGPRPAPRGTVLPKPERSDDESDAQYEARRMSHLRQRADEGLGNSAYAMFDAPPGLEHLELAYDDPTLPGLLTEAFRRAVERCQQTHGALDAERNLFWIASKMKNVAALTDGDRRRAHAWVQTATELIRDPGFQHLLVCNLADQARRDGDLDRARALLETTDATPWQLPLDSEYRTSAGMFALVSDDIEGVLRLVGEDNDQVPFTRAAIFQACFMRATALELAGRAEEAEAVVAFNLEVLPKDVIEDWLAGSTTLAPVTRTLERIRGRDPESLVEILSYDDDDDDDDGDDELEPLPAEPISITPAQPSRREVTRRRGRALWITSAVLAVFGLVAAWAYLSL